MATKLPRVTIVMPHEMHRTLTRAREATNQSMSSLVVEMLELGMPTLDRMADAFQSIRRASEKDRQKVRARCDEVLQELEPLAAESFRLLDGVLTEMEGGVTVPPTAEAGGAPATRLIAGAASHSPPSTNRGGTNHSPDDNALKKGVS